MMVTPTAAADEPFNPPTPFDTDYMAWKDGTSEISIPEAFELANILLVLTD